MKFGEDGVCGFGPDEGLGIIVVLVNVAVDGGLEVDYRVEGAALEPPAREDREEALDGVEPGGGGWGEVEHPSGMTRQPGADLGMLVGGVVVEDDVDRSPPGAAGRDERGAASASESAARPDP